MTAHCLFLNKEVLAMRLDYVINRDIKNYLSLRRRRRTTKELLEKINLWYNCDEMR